VRRLFPRYRSLSYRFRHAKPGAFTKEDIDRYRDAWSQPGALTAQINPAARWNKRISYCRT
jgi:hypothetical protein